MGWVTWLVEMDVCGVKENEKEIMYVSFRFLLTNEGARLD